MKKQEICRESKANKGVLCASNQKDLPAQEIFLIFAIIPTGEMVAGEDQRLVRFGGHQIIPTGEMVAGEDDPVTGAVKPIIIPTGEMVAGEDRIYMHVMPGLIIPTGEMVAGEDRQL